MPALVGSYISPPGDRRYCAPEMLGCLHDEDPAIAFTSDFFSLGAILFEMFSGPYSDFASLTLSFGQISPKRCSQSKVGSAGPPTIRSL